MRGNDGMLLTILWQKYCLLNINVLCMSRGSSAQSGIIRDEQTKSFWNYGRQCSLIPFQLMGLSS